MELTQTSPDSHLIILRPQQWKLIWNSRPRRALIHGPYSSGKSMALELGLAFASSDKPLCLVSFAKFGNAQNILRSFHYEGTDIKLFYPEKVSEGSLQVLQ